MNENKAKFVFIILLLILNFKITAQSHGRYSLSHSKKEWFVSSAVGVQISGIKEEDFIKTNVAPAITATCGFWLEPVLGLGITYKGPYFYYIGDDERHEYLFTGAEVLFNVNEILNSEKEMKNKFSTIGHFGPGYFYNDYLDQSQLTINGGLNNNVELSKRIDVFVDVSFIIGWDIYQGNEDILPSAAIGVSYLFK